MGRREELQRELENLKREIDMDLLKYDMKLAYLGNEKAIENINKVFKFEDNNNEYLLKHVKKAEEILSDIIHSDLVGRFFNYEQIAIKWSKYIKIGTNGHWHTNGNTMTINCKYLLNKDEFENSFNDELLNTIQHELIHSLIAHKMKKLDLIINADASPVHQAIITYFNAHECNISSNGNLSNVFKMEQLELYNLATNKNITFDKLIQELNAWQEKIKEKLVEIKKRNIYVQGFSEYAAIVSCFKESNEYTKCNLDTSKKTYVFEKGECVIPLLILELGMDCNLDKMEEKINEYRI